MYKSRDEGVMDLSSFRKSDNLEAYKSELIENKQHVDFDQCEICLEPIENHDPDLNVSHLNYFQQYQDIINQSNSTKKNLVNAKMRHAKQSSRSQLNGGGYVSVSNILKADKDLLESYIRSSSKQNIDLSLNPVPHFIKSNSNSKSMVRQHVQHAQTTNNQKASDTIRLMMPSPFAN